MSASWFGSVLGGFAVEEQDVGLDALGINDPGRPAQQGVDIRLIHQFAPDGLIQRVATFQFARTHPRREGDRPLVSGMRRRLPGKQARGRGC